MAATKVATTETTSAVKIIQTFGKKIIAAFVRRKAAKALITTVKRFTATTTVRPTKRPLKLLDS